MFTTGCNCCCHHTFVLLASTLVSGGGKHLQGLAGFTLPTLAIKQAVTAAPVPVLVFAVCPSQRSVLTE